MNPVAKISGARFHNLADRHTVTACHARRRAAFALCASFDVNLSLEGMPEMGGTKLGRARYVGKSSVCCQLAYSACRGRGGGEVVLHMWQRVMHARVVLGTVAALQQSSSGCCTRLFHSVKIVLEPFLANDGLNVECCVFWGTKLGQRQERRAFWSWECLRGLVSNQHTFSKLVHAADKLGAADPVYHSQPSKLLVQGLRSIVPS